MQTTICENAVSEDQLVEVVETVCCAMLCLPIRRSHDESAVHGSVPLAAYVHIAGTWNGTVLLLCGEQFGRNSASIMLESPQPEVKLTDVHDAIAELVNIIGGGIKSILPGPSTLSLPTVTYGSHYNVHIPHTQQVAQIEFICDGEIVQLRLLQAAPGR